MPLVQPHPTPSFHQRSLCRRVRGLETVSGGGVLGVGEPVVGICLEGGKLPDQCREVAGCVPDYVLRVLRTLLRQPNLCPKSVG
jgi:predicted ThiF/HesA family dinucleotide-utilizing enzyme